MTRFDADTNALRTRAAVNAQQSRSNLEEWIVGQVALRPGMTVLDLGCGLGKQLFYLAGRLPAGSRLVGFDISAAAVAAVNEQATKEARGNVVAEQVALDDCIQSLGERRFDLILSTYAIYYSRQMVPLLQSLALALNPAGTLFISGPGLGTNREIVSIMNDCLSASGRIQEPGDFISTQEIEAVASSYRAHHSAKLDNTVDFITSDAAEAWWRNHNLFRPEIEACVTAAIRQKISREGRFSLTKNVLGVRFDARH